MDFLEILDVVLNGLKTGLLPVAGGGLLVWAVINLVKRIGKMPDGMSGVWSVRLSALLSVGLLVAQALSAEDIFNQYLPQLGNVFYSMYLFSFSSIGSKLFNELFKFLGMAVELSAGEPDKPPASSLMLTLDAADLNTELGEMKLKIAELESFANSG